eukprot:scaffold22060_cov68-Phaeocystis_antarctica.AAC.4
MPPENQKRLETCKNGGRRMPQRSSARLACVAWPLAAVRLPLTWWRMSYRRSRLERSLRGTARRRCGRDTARKLADSA